MVDELEQLLVEAHGQASASEVVADGVLPAGEADQAGGVDEAVDLNRVAGLADGEGWRAGGVAALVDEAAQVGDGQSGWDGLEPYPGW